MFMVFVWVSWLRHVFTPPCQVIFLELCQVFPCPVRVIFQPLHAVPAKVERFWPLVVGVVHLCKLVADMTFRGVSIYSHCGGGMKVRTLTLWPGTRPRYILFPSALCRCRWWATNNSMQCASLFSPPIQRSKRNYTSRDRNRFGFWQTRLPFACIARHHLNPSGTLLRCTLCFWGVLFWLQSC